MKSFRQYNIEAQIHVGGGNTIHGHQNPSKSTMRSLLRNSKSSALRTLHWKEGKKHKTVMFDAGTLHDEVIDAEGLHKHKPIRGHLSYGEDKGHITDADRKHYKLKNIKDNHIVGEFTHSPKTSKKTGKAERITHPWVKKNFGKHHATHPLEPSMHSHVSHHTHDLDD